MRGASPKAIALKLSDISISYFALFLYYTVYIRMRAHVNVVAGVLSQINSQERLRVKVSERDEAALYTDDGCCSPAR